MTIDQIALPPELKISFVRTIYIKIHGHEKLSALDQGRALCSYVRANGLDGYPDFSKSANGIFAFDLKRPQGEIDKEKEEFERSFYKAVTEIMRFEEIASVPPSGETQDQE